MARARGAQVLVVEPDATRRGLAEVFGLTALDPAADDVAGTIADTTAGEGADVVFEVSGSPDGILAATQHAALRGRIVVVAIFPEPRPVALFDVFWKELELRGARVYEPEDFEAAIALIASGSLGLERLITAVEPLERAPGRVRRAAGGQAGHEDPRGLPHVNAAPFDLAGRTALVTGCRRGIGKAAAVALAAAGAEIVGVSASLEPGSDVAAAVEAHGRSFRSYRCDFADRAAVYDLVAAVRREVQRVDILINNAGTIARAPAAEHPDELWDRVLEVNLTAQFVLARELGRDMLERGSGKIVFIASLLSFQGGITVPGYTASKSGITGLTKALANEWAGGGVNVNAVAPGYVSTDNTQALREDAERYEQILAPDSGRPLGRARGHRRRNRVPLLAGCRLRTRRGAAGRRRLARAMSATVSLAEQVVLAALEPSRCAACRCRGRRGGGRRPLRGAARRRHLLHRDHVPNGCGNGSARPRRRGGRHARGRGHGADSRTRRAPPQTPAPPSPWLRGRTTTSSPPVPT